MGDCIVIVLVYDCFPRHCRGAVTYAITSTGTRWQCGVCRDGPGVGGKMVQLSGEVVGYVIRSAESACSSRIIPASNARTSRTRRLRCKPHVPQEWAVDLLFFTLPSLTIRGFDAVPRRKEEHVMPPWICIDPNLSGKVRWWGDGWEGGMDGKEGWQDK